MDTIFVFDSMECHSEEWNDEESPITEQLSLQNGDSSLPMVAQNDIDNI